MRRRAQVEVFARATAMFARRLRTRHTGAHALHNQRLLKLSHRADHREHHLAHGRTSVDLFTEAHEVNAQPPKLLQRRQQVRRGAGKAVKLPDSHRYLCRPALATHRVELLENDEVVRLKLKTPWRDGTTHLRMHASEFVMRLLALIPNSATYYPSCVTMPSRRRCARSTIDRLFRAFKSCSSSAVNWNHCSFPVPPP